MPLSKSQLLKISYPILVIGFLFGLILSYGLISGDQQGRVNIIKLIAVYIFLPILSLLFSILSLALGKSWNFAKLSSSIPLWSQQHKNNFFRLAQHPLSKFYFFYQSQLAALSFSLASLLVLVILLVSSDVNFVWRSTLLDAEQLYPLLKWLASPWLFWQTAQPTIELLFTTQDSRLSPPDYQINHFAGWWQFILAAQIFYAFLLRFISIVGCRVILKIAFRPSQSVRLSRSHMVNKQVQSMELEPPIHDVNTDYSLNNWCGLEEAFVQQLLAKLSFSKTSELNAGPLVSYAQQLVSERWQATQLIVVKGWEPPLAELADFMQNGKGYLLPVDWNNAGFVTLNKAHFEEWQRFISQFEQWQILDLEGL